jgi:GABA(A) receptor-associated protein
MEKYPDKLPIICEKNSSKEPNISKTKYLVAVDLKIAQFIFVLRSKMHIDPTQAIYLFVNGGTLVPSSTYLATIYELYKDDDGFLYLNYAFENTFGKRSD